jgi:hypothetical protein
MNHEQAEADNLKGVLVQGQKQNKFPFRSPGRGLRTTAVENTTEVHSTQNCTC